MRYRCPVCMYDSLPYPPADYHVCPCCGTEFGNDDAEYSLEQLREMWVAGGANWFFGKPPTGWNPWRQLIDAGQAAYVPKYETRLLANAGLAVGPPINLTGTPWAVPLG